MRTCLRRWVSLALGAAFTIGFAGAVPSQTRVAQVPPSAEEVGRYDGLHAAAARGDVTAIERLVDNGANPQARDANSRTPLHVAAHFGHHRTARALLQRGANPNAFDAQRYDIVTIAAVRNDVEMLAIALAHGADPRAVTSPYAGTALIAAAHLGHVAIVRRLIAAGAPLDHVNNLGWTGLMESIVLGDGGADHTATLAALVEAGADINIPDRQGRTPLAHARARGFAAMVKILEAAGAR